MSTRNFIIFITLIACVLTGYVRSYEWESYGLNYDEGATVLKMNKIKALPLVEEYLTLQHMSAEKVLASTTLDLANDIYHSFPGYFVLAKFWVGDFSWPVVQNLRAFSLFWAILTVPMIGLIAIRFGKVQAIFAILIALLHPMLQYHGTYIRFYSLFVFASAFGVAMSVWIPYWLTRSTGWVSQHKLMHYALLLLLAIATIIPILIHLGGFIVSFAIFLLSVFYFRNTRSGWIYYILTMVLAVIPMLKSLFFLYIRAVDPSQGSNIMSSSSVHAIFSLIFNYGVGVSLAAVAGVIIFSMQDRVSGDKKASLHFVYFSQMLVGAVMPMLIVIFIKPTIFRADYAVGLLPAVIVMASAFLVKIISEFNNRQSKIIGGAVFFALILFPTLPTFISNVFIDGDRPDYNLLVEKINALSGGEPVIVYSDVPGYLEYASQGLTHISYKHLKDYKHEESSVPVFGVSREAKGFGNRFLPELTTLNGPVRAVIGKNRLDHRLVRFYIVELAPGIVSN